MGNSASKQFNDQQKQICLPVETWTDILLFISRNELAQTVSLTNWLFNAISRPRIDEHNKRIIPSLRFSKDGNGMAKLRFSRSFVQIPIAQVPPPINILGFERLSFRFINHQTLEFLRLIKPILGTNVSFRMRNRNESAIIQQLFKIIQEIFFEKSLLPMPIHQLCNIIKGNVSKLATNSNNFTLFNMEFLKTIQFVRLDGGNAINEHILGWIHSPLDGNKPRYIFMDTYNINEFVEICKKRFLESIVPVSFIFHFDEEHFDEETLIWGEPNLFSIENHQTGEQLTLGLFNDEGRSYFMLCRFKIGDDQGWRQIMKKVNNPNENRTKLRIKL